MCVCVWCVYVCVSVLRCLKQYVFLPFRGEIVLFVLVLNADPRWKERARVSGGRIPHVSFLKSQGPRTDASTCYNGEGEGVLL